MNNDNNQNNNENGDNNINSDDSTLPSNTDKKDDNQQITAPKTGDSLYEEREYELIAVFYYPVLLFLSCRRWAVCGDWKTCMKIFIEIKK